MKTIEEKILAGVWEMLVKKANGYIEEMDEHLKPLEKPRKGKRALSDCKCRHGVAPTVYLVKAERMGKNKLYLRDVYTVTVKIEATEIDNYRYGMAIIQAMNDDPTLGGVAHDVLAIRRLYGDTTEWTLRVYIQAED